MKKVVEERVICRDDKGYRYVVLRLRHIISKTIGGEHYEVPGTFEYVLEGLPPIRHVNVVEEGKVYQLVEDDTVLRRIED